DDLRRRWEGPPDGPPDGEPPQPLDGPGGGVALLDPASLNRYVSMYSVAPDVTRQTVGPADHGPSEHAEPGEIPGYEILGELGRGGMGVVYRAMQTAINRTIALKVIRTSHPDSPDVAARFLREARALARLEHPNIIGVYDFDEYAGGCYFSMEYCEGG